MVTTPKLASLFLRIHSEFIFVSIYCDNLLFCIIKRGKTLPCYCPTFTLYVGHYETESSLLLVLIGCSLWSIICFIKTSFHIHSPFFVSWMFYCFVYKSTCGGSCRYIRGSSNIKKIRGDVQV